MRSVASSFFQTYVMADKSYETENIVNSWVVNEPENEAELKMATGDSRGVALATNLPTTSSPALYYFIAKKLTQYVPALS